MKKRLSFVSNSSSSSYIIVFPREPKSPDDLKKMIFDTDYGYDGHDSISIANYIWAQIKSQTINNYEEAYQFFANDDDSLDWSNDYEERIRERGKQAFDKFFQTRRNKLKKIEGENITDVFYTFEFSDHNTIGSILDHDGHDIFRKLKHKRISMH